MCWGRGTNAGFGDPGRPQQLLPLGCPGLPSHAPLGLYKEEADLLPLHKGPRSNLSIMLPLEQRNVHGCSVPIIEGLYTFDSDRPNLAP